MQQYGSIYFAGRRPDPGVGVKRLKFNLFRIWSCCISKQIDFELKRSCSPPPLGNFADISYLEENFKPHLLRDVCTLCSGALVSDSLLHMLL